LLGILDWRGLNIPVITWERLVEKSEPAWKTQRMYIVILNTLNKNPAVSHIGLLSVGISRLTRIRADILEEDQEAAINSPLIKSSVKVTNATADLLSIRAWIPDLDQLVIFPFHAFAKTFF
jgi:chemosensory pili system protein ChpC